MSQNKSKAATGGFSLIEIMVAIAILAIITVPMMTYFAQSEKQNVRSGETQEAMLAGQTVMEEVKNLTVKEIWDSPAYANLRLDNTEETVGTPFTERPVTASQPYSFAAKNRTATGLATGPQYDVYFTIDQRTFADTNQTDMAYMPEAAGTDVVTIVQSTQDDEGVSMCGTQHRNAYDALDATERLAISERSIDFIREHLTKDITVKIDYTDPADPDTIQIDLDFLYKPVSDEIHGVQVSDTFDVDTTPSYTVDTPTGSALSIYFFYHALPGADSEAVHVISNVTQPVEVYMICQVNSSGKLPEEEGRSYFLSQSTSGSGAGTTKIRSNVPINASLGSGTPLIDKKKRQRLFEMNIRVYKSGDTSKVLAEYDSAKGVWNDEE